MDTRPTQLATVLLDHSLKIQSGEKLLICTSDFSPLPLLQETYRLGIERGAHVELDVLGIQMQRGRADFGGFAHTLLSTGSDEQLRYVSDILNTKFDWADAFLFIGALEDDLFLSDIDTEKFSLWSRSKFALNEKLFEKRWVLTQWPTNGFAEKCDLAPQEAIDFYYQACLVDYAAESARIKQLQDILDEGKTVRIIGSNTDLTLGIEGRLAAGANTGRRNIPDGECFLGPVEDQTEGTITFELPQVRSGHEVRGIKLEFRNGKIERATAEHGEALLLRTLEEDPGNRRLGELGIGMNRFITNYLKQTLFDEKIAGTVHVALGRSYDEQRGGGKNRGSIHWDLVKDLRHSGTSVTVDDRVIMKDGKLHL